MADHFLGALKEIERRAQNNILVFSDVLTERLEVIAQNMVGKSIKSFRKTKISRPCCFVF